MTSEQRDYAYYRRVFEGIRKPFAFVDLDLFDRNVAEIAARSGGKRIRVASKSVRCVTLLERIFEQGAGYRGLMCFSPREAVYLSRQGFDDLLLAYPIWNERDVREVADEVRCGATIVCMVDAVEHVEQLDRVAAAQGVELALCLDVDMSSSFPGIHFGVWRSGIVTVQRALEVAKRSRELGHVRLDGVMGYEAQIAGLPDTISPSALKNRLVQFLKRRSIREVAERRAKIVTALQEAGHGLRFVNAGGTGSMESTREEGRVTEITVGSGFYSPTLFDHYRAFRHQPAAGYAIEITRRPKEHIYTCHGGGYPASGAVGKDKEPRPFLPQGARLLSMEGAGEVQTPVHYQGEERLALGDPILMRHSKAGELCERFNTLLLVSDGAVVQEVNTYRGDGKCFL
jgi:D-serine deaminase-like pyridoxal phosphate-dependent protein